jgi:hypothetical protein
MNKELKLKMYAVIKHGNEFIAFNENNDAQIYAEENGGHVQQILATRKKYYELTGHNITAEEFAEMVSYQQ